MKKLLAYLKVIISLTLLAGLGWIMKDKFAAIGGIIATADRVLIFLSIILVISGMVIQAYRLKFLLDVQNIHLGIKDLICLTFIGQFFNNFMPTAVGGDVVKAYFVSTGTQKKLETFTSIAMDRIVGMITLVWVALFAMAFYYRQIPNSAAVAVIAVASVVGTVFMGLVFNEKAARALLFIKRFFKSQPAGQRIERLYEATNNYRQRKKMVFGALFLSLAVQLVFFFMIYLLAVSISSRVPFSLFLITLPVISTVSMLPSINGLGIRESGFVYFLGPMMGREKAFALSLLYLGLVLLVGMTGGVVLLFKKEFKHLAEGEQK